LLININKLVAEDMDLWDRYPGLHEGMERIMGHNSKIESYNIPNQNPFLSTNLDTSNPNMFQTLKEMLNMLVGSICNFDEEFN
jgi:ribosomal protein L16 Arg81 hydroxylase